MKITKEVYFISQFFINEGITNLKQKSIVCENNSQLFVFHIGVEVNCKRKFKGKNQCQRFFFNKLVKAIFTKK